MEEVDVTKFKQLLKCDIDDMRMCEGLQQLFQYFENVHCSRCEQWALCHRKAAGIITNMYTESFRRVLKYVYMQGKINKRMDSIIHVPMKYARDKAFDRVTITE